MAEKKPADPKQPAAKKAAGKPGKSGTKKIRVKKKAKKRYVVPNSRGKRRMKSVKARWRRQRGIDNKKKIRKAFMGKSPRVGDRNAEGVRGLHPLGLPEVLVHNASELEGMGKVLVRIASGVGKRKREEIAEKAEGMGLRVLNRVVK